MKKWMTYTRITVIPNMDSWEQPTTLDILLNLKTVVFDSVQNSEKVTVTTTVTRRRQVSTVKDESKRSKNHCILITPQGI